MRILFLLKIYVYRQKEQPGQNKLKLPPSTPLTAFLIAERLLSL